MPNHCEFKGWSTRNDYLQTINYLSGAKYNGNANLELYAYYMCEQSIKFDARGGTIVSYEPAFGTKVNINQATYTKKQYSETLFNKMVIGSSEDEFVVTKSGYTFRGWSEDASCNSVKQLGNIYIDGNATSKTLYACYNKTSNSGNTDNVDKNPQTGSIAIFIIWVIGIVAVVYSAWYFRKLRNN